MSLSPLPEEHNFKHLHDFAVQKFGVCKFFFLYFYQGCIYLYKNTVKNGNIV